MPSPDRLTLARSYPLTGWASIGLGKPLLKVSLTSTLPLKSTKDGDLQELMKMFFKLCTFARSRKQFFFLSESNLSEIRSLGNWVERSKGRRCQRLETEAHFRDSFFEKKIFDT